MQDKEHAAVEVNERKEKLKEKDNFYKITLSTVEDIELEELEIAISKLTNAMPFRKAVYDVYYKNKMLDLVKRLKVSDVMGIYKITNILNEKVYVGQSVDIGNR
jgi:DNA-binding Lrp family transcriptional regulator